MFVKKILAILFSGMVLSTSLTASAYAETTSAIVESEISPTYVIAANVMSNLSTSGKTAYCTSEASGLETTRITVEQTLQKQGFLWSWSEVKDARWTTTVNKSAISAYNSKNDLDSGKYRLKSVFTLTDKYGKTETITEYSAVKSI